jgi:hypothetical protein
MGRNETLNDAPVLQAAHRAYRDNGGSMKALITSLLTSDAFLYRTSTGVDRRRLDGRYSGDVAGRHHENLGRCRRLPRRY